MTSIKSSGFRSFSLGYGISIGFALAGWVFVAIALGAVLEARLANNPITAINVFGLLGFALMMALSYAMRLIFWERIELRKQELVRKIIIGFAIVEVGLSGLAVALVMAGFGSSPMEPSALTATWTCVVATLFQIATVTWLVRYRHE